MRLKFSDLNKVAELLPFNDTKHVIVRAGLHSLDIDGLLEMLKQKKPSEKKRLNPDKYMAVYPVDVNFNEPGNILANRQAGLCSSSIILDIQESLIQVQIISNVADGLIYMDDLTEAKVDHWFIESVSRAFGFELEAIDGYRTFKSWLPKLIDVCS